MELLFGARNCSANRKKYPPNPLSEREVTQRAWSAGTTMTIGTTCNVSEAQKIMCFATCNCYKEEKVKGIYKKQDYLLTVA